MRGYIIISKVNYFSSPVQSQDVLFFVYTGAVAACLVQWLYYKLDNGGIVVCFLAGASGFPQMCSQWLLGIPSLMFSRDWWLFLQGQNSQVVKLTTHLSLIPRLRVGGTILRFPHVHSWCAHGQLHLYLHVYLLYMSLHIV